VGPMYPLSTLVIQNVVLPHQFGTATGTLNFFRQLGSALIVAGFGAIVLAGVGAAVHDPVTLKRLTTEAGAIGVATVFHWVFRAAAAALAVGLAFLFAMEELPLRDTIKTPIVPRAAE
jgi:energy-converting hydrogenase Eha subunit E